MNKKFLFGLLGTAFIVTMNSCKSNELDLNKELKFSKLSVEEQKASIEQNGMSFVTAMEGMQNTKAMTTVLNMISMTGAQVYGVPLQKLAADIKNGRSSALKNFDKQLRVNYVKSEDEVWGEYVYNFDTEELEQVKSLTNQLVVSFPATSTATTNNAKFTVAYEESNVAMPNGADMSSEGMTIDKYPSKITVALTVDGAKAMSADFSGKYYTDGSPQDVSQSLTIDTYTWTAEIKNDKKTASEAYEFKNGKTVLLKSSAELNGALTESAVTFATENDSLEYAVSGFAAYLQVMDVAIKGGVTDFKGMMKAGKAIDYEKLTDKQAAEKEAEIFNKYMVATAFFVDANQKFADVDFYAKEYTDEWQEWDYNQQKLVTQTYTYYDVTPRFILSDGSKVAVEEYVKNGFGEITQKFQDMASQFEGDY